MQRAILFGVLTICAAFIPVGSVAAQPFTGDVLIFVAAPALYQGADRLTREFDVYVDRKKGCTHEDAQDDDGWICKAGKVTAGKHSLKVRINTTVNHKTTVRQVQGVVVLKPENKGIEYPDNPGSGEQFWCVQVSEKKLTLMSKDDKGCHTD